MFKWSWYFFLAKTIDTVHLDELKFFNLALTQAEIRMMVESLSE